MRGQKMLSQCPCKTKRLQNLGQTTLRDEDNKSASPKKIIVGNISNQNNS